MFIVSLFLILLLNRMQENGAIINYIIWKSYKTEKFLSYLTKRLFMTNL